MVENNSAIVVKSISKIKIVGARAFDMDSVHQNIVEKYISDEYLFFMYSQYTHKQQVKLTNTTNYTKPLCISGKSLHLITVKCIKLIGEHNDK